jgi:hypothetical protein
MKDSHPSEMRPTSTPQNHTFVRLVKPQNKGIVYEEPLKVRQRAARHGPCVPLNVTEQ